MSEHASGAGLPDPFRFVGYQIKIFDHPTGYVQWRFPRTKKRRIRKKWAKRKENLKPEFLKDAMIHEASKSIICTSIQLAAIQRQLGYIQDRVQDDTQQGIGDTLTPEHISRLQERMRFRMKQTNFERAYGNIHNSPAFRRQDER